VEWLRFFFDSCLWVEEGCSGAGPFGVLACALVFSSVIFGAVGAGPEDVERVLPMQPCAPLMSMAWHGFDALADVTYTDLLSEGVLLNKLNNKGAVALWATTENLARLLLVVRIRLVDAAAHIHEAAFVAEQSLALLILGLYEALLLFVPDKVCWDVGEAAIVSPVDLKLHGCAHGVILAAGLAESVNAYFL